MVSFEVLTKYPRLNLNKERAKAKKTEEKEK
jgi:hypothetical protein